MDHQEAARYAARLADQKSWERSRRAYMLCPACSGSTGPGGTCEGDECERCNSTGTIREVDATEDEIQAELAFQVDEVEARNRVDSQ